MSTHLWLRAETKPFETRCAISPENARLLVERGFTVTVEQSAQACFEPALFEAAGCRLAPGGSWVDAPDDAFVLGLKELPEAGTPLRHRHIYFAHAYKGQRGWQGLLKRFEAGGGTLYDLEYLEDPPGRRVATYGYWAGYAGAALAVSAWSHGRSDEASAFRCAASYPSQRELVEQVGRKLARVGSAPRAIVIGAAGRCGRGACELLDELGVDVTRWDIEETGRGGPFGEILEHDVFINCVFVSEPIPPFLTLDMLGRLPRRLSVICDVSCDPFGDMNPLPIYRETTTFERPTTRVADGEPPLDLIAIDHLPSMLPAESSASFSEQLLPYLCQLDDPGQGVWAAAAAKFEEMVAKANGGIDTE